MQWADEGVILSVRPHGETAAVAEIFTRAHGRHLGLVHGGRSRKLRPVLQTGNHVDATWKARLSEHLGHVSVELRKGYAAQAMEDPLALAGLSSLCALARLLPERDPHPSLYRGHAVRAGLSRRSRRVAGTDGALGAGAAGRAGLWARPVRVRGDREKRRSHLRVAEIGPRRIGSGGRALQGPPAAAAAFPRQGAPSEPRHVPTSWTA